MKLDANRARAFIARPEKAMRGALLYGPDPSLTNEMRRALQTALLAGDDDPFRLVEIAPDQARRDPALLLDECDAMSFGGGDRVICCPEATDAAAPAIINAIDQMKGGAFLIVSAGALAPTSKLRKYFEGSKLAVSAAFYPAEGAELEGALAAALRDLNAQATPGALALGAAALSGADHGAIRRFAEILALAAHGRDALTEEDVAALMPLETEAELDALAQAVARGDSAAIPPLMRRLESQSGGPGAALRVTAQYLRRLARVQAMADEAGGLEAAAARLRPPVFFKIKSAFLAQARRWPAARLAAGLSAIDEAEGDLRSGRTLPESALVERVLMRLAMSGPR